MACRRTRGWAIGALALVLSLTVAACGGSSKKSHARSPGGITTSTTSTPSSAKSTSTSTGGVTSAPGSPNPYGPNSPTSPTGLGRILVKNGYAKSAASKCIASGLLKELSPPEVQALAAKKASTALKARVAAASRACAGGAPSGG
ncbi:MAG: hypothetical protein E6G00_12735 [Actinobacteria bacterium]|nr:MAG: hypothetical protein E6G29_11090 [Actinomycetota bacterium]TMM08308.1 MAG: hypothetical protein E6G00_12735 [Actinomycetota bacterium]